MTARDPRAVVVLIVVAASACSGAPASREPAAPAQARAAFLSRADEICAEANAALRAIPMPAVADTDPATMAPVFAESAAVNDRLGRQLRSLEVPAGDAAELVRLLDRHERVTGHIAALAETGAVGDTGAFFATLDALEVAAVDLAGWATRLGFAECFVATAP